MKNLGAKENDLALSRLRYAECFECYHMPSRIVGQYGEVTIGRHYLQSYIA